MQKEQTETQHHAQKIETRLDALIAQMREDVQKVDDPKAQALFETSAEVLTGLKTAYAHFQQQSEAAWR